MYLRGHVMKPGLGIMPILTNGDRPIGRPIPWRPAPRPVPVVTSTGGGSAPPIAVVTPPSNAPTSIPAATSTAIVAATPLPQSNYPVSTLVPAFQANAGTPVPNGYPTSQLFVNSDQSVWEYSNSTGRWSSVGTPYNAGSSTAASATATNSASSTVGTPVPAGFPTNSTYVAPDGSQWNFNPTTNSWQYGGSATGGSSGITTAAPAAAAATPASAVASDYQSVLDWLQVSDTTALISGIPNWAVALGAALLVAKATNMNKGKR
jgi:hypothetical protein